MKHRGDEIMRTRSISVAAIAALGLPCLLSGSGISRAQTVQQSVLNIALKNGESLEVSDVAVVSSECRSLLTATPEVEIMDGPPGVAATIKQAMVVPRIYSCAKPVSGGKLVITANNIEDYSYTRMILRIKYKTRSGDRATSWHFNVTLFP